MTKQYLKFISLILLSITLTSLTFLLGAIPLRILRKSFSRQAYWLAMGITSSIAFLLLGKVLAVVLVVLTTLVGLYCDAEEGGASIFSAGLFSIITTSSFCLVSAAIWSQKYKQNLVALTRQQVEVVVEKAISMSPQLNMSVDSILYQIPAYFVICLLVALAMSLVFDSRISNVFGIEIPKANLGALLGFKTPDVFIWAMIVAVLGAFGQQKYIGLQNVSFNFVYILGAIFFFQGMAVLKVFFLRQRMSPIWQALWFFIFVVQLFPLGSFLGFSDYWVDFRSRWSKPLKPARNLKSEN